MPALITLREFAEKNKIKKPTVNARLKKLEKNNPDKTLTIKKENVIYLTENGLALLEKSFNENPVKVTGKKKTKKRVINEPVKENERELKKLYQNQISRLENDLKASRRENERLYSQIDKLTAMVSELTGALSGALLDSQRLLNQEQSLALIDKTGSNEKKKEKKSLFARLAVAGKVLKGDFD